MIDPFINWLQFTGDAIVALWNTLDTITIVEPFSLLDFMIDGFLIEMVALRLKQWVNPTYQEHNQFGGKE